MKKILVAIAALVFTGTAHAQTISSFGVPANSINVTLYGVSASASDNATALQAAINLAVTNKQALYIPSASSCYKYTAPLTISGNLTIVGDYVSGNWAGANQINVPSGTPPIIGSVLCPNANGSDAIDISGTALQVNISNIGILFQTTFGQSSTTTGDAIHYIPTSTNQGLTGGVWNNVMVYGHDGNHYAFNLQNPIYGTFTQLFSVGGGTLKLSANAGNYGNMTFVQLAGQVVVGGSANGANLSADASQHLNLISFIRPQIIVNNVSGVSPAANLPTSSQLIWNEDVNVTNIRKTAPDLETNVGSSITLGSPAVGNDADFAGLFTTAASINAPAWLTSGVLYGPQVRTFTDTTSSGTVPLAATISYPGGPIKASSPVTYTLYATLYVGLPSPSTNVTMPSAYSIYALGGIYSNSILAAKGAYITGSSQWNTNASTATTEIGDGTTSGTVTIGGTSNSTLLNSATLTATNLATDSTHTDRTVCQDTTSKSLFFGSGTAGVCLGTSSARFKHNITDLDTGIDQIMKLRPVSYEYNADHGDPDHVLYGFTAEDMAKTLPKLVGADADGMPNSADYLGVVPVLVKGMQQLKAENDSLRACNDNWKCRIFGIR